MSLRMTLFPLKASGNESKGKKKATKKSRLPGHNTYNVEFLARGVDNFDGIVEENKTTLVGTVSYNGIVEAFSFLSFYSFFNIGNGYRHDSWACIYPS